MTRGRPSLKKIASVIAFSLSILAAPLAADAQPAGKVYRIGYLQTSTREQQLHLSVAIMNGVWRGGYTRSSTPVSGMEGALASANPLSTYPVNSAWRDCVVVGPYRRTGGCLVPMSRTPLPSSKCAFPAPCQPLLELTDQHGATACGGLRGAEAARVAVAPPAPAG